MCGIWGSIGFHVSKNVIDVIRHRGPDGEGWREFQSKFGPIFLGHRRLNILQAESPEIEQPFKSHCGKYYIVFNGEIYNYLSIKKELIQKKYEFKTNTDTEVVLMAFIEWGKDSLNKLNGMFAFVVYDLNENVLFIARDRFGIKPIYYYMYNQKICFSSEIKQILKILPSSPLANIERCVDFINYGLTNHTNETLYQDIYAVRPGECIKINLNNTIEPLFEKWNEFSVEKNSYDLKKSLNEFDNLFREAILSHLNVDGPICLSLSGGLDSSAIYAYVNDFKDRQLHNKIFNTFSIISDHNNDIKYINDIKNQLNISNTIINLKFEDFLTDLETLMWHQEEPFGGTSVFAQWKLFKEVAITGNRVLLCGQGADELLAGYQHLPEIYRLQKTNELGISKKAYHFDSYLIKKYSQTYLNIQYANLQLPGSNTPNHKHQDLSDACIDLINYSSLPMLLRYEDKNSMAHGVEARVPFLDNNFSNFSLNLHSAAKIHHGQTKYIMKILLKDKIPDSVINRKKAGFTSPEHIWLRKQKLQILMSHTIQELFPMWSKLFSTDLVGDIQSRAFFLNNDMLTSWRIFCFYLWAKTFEVVSPI